MDYTQKTIYGEIVRILKQLKANVKDNNIRFIRYNILEYFNYIGVIYSNKVLKLHLSDVSPLIFKHTPTVFKILQKVEKTFDTKEHIKFNISIYRFSNNIPRHGDYPNFNTVLKTYLKKFKLKTIYYSYMTYKNEFKFIECTNYIEAIYKLQLEHGNIINMDWLVYDIGSLDYVPYFDNLHNKKAKKGEVKNSNKICGIIITDLENAKKFVTNYYKIQNK